MIDPVYLNARADRCSAPLLESGQRIVFYHGERSSVVGLFFARGRDGQRELFYILRLLPLPGHSDGLAEVRELPRLNIVTPGATSPQGTSVVSLSAARREK